MSTSTKTSTELFSFESLIDEFSVPETPKEKPTCLWFGKHKDKEFSKVPYSYLEWLMNSKETKEYLKDVISEHLETRTKPVPIKPEDYVVPFGKHKNKTLKECPYSYLKYMIQNQEKSKFLNDYQLHMFKSHFKSRTEPVVTKPEDYILPFGKNKGRKISDLDTKYLMLVIKQHLNDENTFTLNEYQLYVFKTVLLNRKEN